MASSAELSVDALALAMKTAYDSTAARDFSVRCQLRLNGDILLLTVDNGRLDVARANGADPELVIETSVTVFRSLEGRLLALTRAHHRSAVAAKLPYLFGDADLPALPGRRSGFPGRSLTPDRAPFFSGVG